MQANCPQCAHRIHVEDARVPDRPFGVRCPKCQATVRFPGRTPAADVQPASTPGSPPAPTPPGAPPAVNASAAPAAPEPVAQDTAAAQDAAPLFPTRRDAAGMGAPEAGSRALVALPDRTQAAAVSLLLSRVGYAVDAPDDWEQGARAFEQSVYALVATARVSGRPGQPEVLYQRLLRLSTEARRQVFVLAVGDEFKSGDGTQAFVAMADLVLNPRDAPSSDGLVRATLAERQRLYQALFDARRRHEAAQV